MMHVSQISVFSESRPGHLDRVLRCLEEAGASVRGYAVADTGEYGILRFVVDEPDAALAALKEQGFACAMTPVLCLLLDDEPGALAQVTGALARCGINILYSYSMISTYIIISVHDVEEAARLLAGEPVRLVSQEEVSAL